MSVLDFMQSNSYSLRTSDRYNLWQKVVICLAVGREMFQFDLMKSDNFCQWKRDTKEKPLKSSIAAACHTGGIPTYFCPK